uniref:Dynactin subunit 2 n=1 Tax=Romanomermis culicivorax TaxID=13658 RepID=A0A915I1C3_ROMCU
MQREDVYETADLPESDQNLNTTAESFDSEHIERIHLTTGEAYQHFKGKSLQTDNVRSVGGEPETLEQQYQRLQNEMRDLASKLEDLKVQKKTLAQIEDQNKSIMVSDVVELQQGLKKLQVEQVLGAEVSNIVTTKQCIRAIFCVASFRLLMLCCNYSEVMIVVENMKPAKKNSSSTKPVTYELFCSPLLEKTDGGRKESSIKQLRAIFDDMHTPLLWCKSKFLNERSQKEVFCIPFRSCCIYYLHHVGALEARLSVIEKRLGGESNKISSIMAETKTKNLMELIETLQQRIALLDNSQLDIVEARLSVLLFKVSQIKDKRSSIDAEQLCRVNELYDVVNKWDALCSSLPQVVSRLESLKELHEQGDNFKAYFLAVQFSQCLTYLDGVQQELNKTLEIDNILLNEVKDSCKQNIETLKNNFSNVEKRIEALTDGH